MPNNNLEKLKKLDVTDWLRNVYGLDDDDCLSAGRVAELVEDFYNDIIQMLKDETDK